MKTETSATQPLQTVETILPQDAVSHLEYIMHWFYDYCDHDDFTDMIMTMLEVYIRHCPDDAPLFRKPDWMTRFVSELIRLKEQLVEVENKCRPGEWVDTPYGWRLPVQDRGPAEK